MSERININRDKKCSTELNFYNLDSILQLPTIGT